MPASVAEAVEGTLVVSVCVSASARSHKEGVAEQAVPCVCVALRDCRGTERRLAPPPVHGHFTVYRFMFRPCIFLS